MKRAVVAIGVNSVGGLPVLSAAVSGAEKIAEWAGKQPFDVELLTDRNGSSVTIAAIKRAIRRFVDPRTYSQLIIYFGGHGVLRGPNNELWLLSGAPDDPTEAVQVSGSIWYARNCGIGHLVFISDACRTPPDAFSLNAVTGTSVFPNLRPRRPRPDVDVFYATLPGDPAYEVPAGQSPADYRGLFTECLVNALVIQPIDVMEHWTDQKPERWVIPCWTLKPYLERVVPEAAAAVSPKYDQFPDIEVLSRPPTFLIECPGYQPPIDAKPRVAGPAAEPESLLAIVGELPDDPRALAPKKSAMGRWRLPKGFDRRAAQDLLSALGRGSAGMGTGFAIFGTKIKRVTAGNTELKCFEENEAQQVNVFWSRPARPGASLLVQFAAGNGAVLPILKGFIGTLVVDHDERVVNVSYVPSGRLKSADKLKKVGELEKRHAYIAAAARTGDFRIAQKDAPNLAEYLRSMESVDPTLGLYAAYAYAQVGATDGVRSVYRQMNGETNPPVPFDVALLAQKLPAKRVLSNMQGVAPFCPMLTQGWGLLDPYLDRLAPQVPPGAASSGARALDNLEAWGSGAAVVRNEGGKTRMKLLLIHGRAQEGKDPAVLQGQWLDALSKGLDKASLKWPENVEIVFPYFGDELDRMVTELDAPLAMDVIARGRSGDDKELEFRQEILSEMAKGYQISDAEIQANLEGEPLKRGISDWKWVHALLKTLDRKTHSATVRLDRFTRDVYVYLTYPAVRKAIDRIVRDQLSAGSWVVVGHSLGTVVGYNVLTALGARSGIDVSRYVTVGAPLGLRSIRDRLDLPLSMPGSVTDWYNAFDPRDVVALYPLDAHNFPIEPPIENNASVENFTDNRHGIAGYLDCAAVARKILEASRPDPRGTTVHCTGGGMSASAHSRTTSAIRVTSAIAPWPTSPQARRLACGGIKMICGRMACEDGRGLVQRPVARDRTGRSVFEQLAKVAERDRALPHQRVHRRRQDHRLGEVPGAKDAAQEIIGDSQRKLREGVGVERSDDQHPGPLPELDVQHLVAAVVGGSRPFVAVGKEWTGAGRARRIAGGLAELGGLEEVECRPGRHHAHFMPRRAERGEESRGPNGGDRASHTENETSHGGGPTVSPAMKGGPTRLSAILVRKPLQASRV